MKDKNYMEVYAMLMIKNVAFSSYMENGSYIINCKDDKIVISENECILNDKVFEDVNELMKEFKGGC